MLEAWILPSSMQPVAAISRLRPCSLMRNMAPHSQKALLKEAVVLPTART
jgi:hypothetical protein